MLLLAPCAAYSQGQAVERPSPGGPTEQGVSGGKVSLRLINGTSIRVDEAWESEQGIWYRQSGLSHLMPRDRVKAVERGDVPQPAPRRQKGKVVAAADETPAVTSTDQPV